MINFVESKKTWGSFSPPTLYSSLTSFDDTDNMLMRFILCINIYSSDLDEMNTLSAESQFFYCSLSRCTTALVKNILLQDLPKNHNKNVGFFFFEKHVYLAVSLNEACCWRSAKRLRD